MRLDAALDDMEEGVLTDAEYADQETELEDVQGFLDDEVMDPSSMDTDLEDAYNGFRKNEGFEGIPVGGYTNSQLEDIVRDDVGLDLPEEGFHVEDAFGNYESEEDIPNSGRLDDYDVEELSNDAPEVTVDEPEAIDYGFEMERFETPDGHEHMDVLEPDVDVEE